MTRFRLTVEFDGGPFMGWQRQAHGPSVQQALSVSVLILIVPWNGFVDVTSQVPLRP